MGKKNAFYAQSGGVTAVINATACGVIEQHRARGHFGTVYAGKDGILGALQENLIDTNAFSDAEIAALKHTPGGAFGSCRYKLQPLEKDDREYRRLIEVFAAHDIDTFFYNGGGDSQDTANKVSQISQRLGYPLTCIGVPKTIDNDLPFTDVCPGFGSVAKYVGVAIQEASLDVASMCSSSTKVFILEVMGRHAGWIAAASGLAQSTGVGAPHLILFPERAFDEAAFSQRVHDCVNQHGFCSIVASEGLKRPDGQFFAASDRKDAFGHHQLGGLAPALSQFVSQELGYKNHWAVADYLQRSARHIASATDVEQAYALGRAAIDKAIEGENAIMPIIERVSSAPYEWKIGQVTLDKVANVEKTMPTDFIDASGFGITDACREYLLPLIQGESYPPYQNGLPNYVALNLSVIPKKLPPFAK